jgi:hypothetical protein
VGGDGVWRDFYSYLSFPGFIGAAKHSSQVSSKLCLLREKVVEEEVFTQRERNEKKKKMKKTTKGTESRELGSRKTINI